MHICTVITHLQGATAYGPLLLRSLVVVLSFAHTVVAL